MFILQRMASSHSLFTHSSLLSIPLLTKPSHLHKPLNLNLNRLFWRLNNNNNNNRHGFSTISSAVATDSSSETSVSDHREKPALKVNDNSEKERVLLPTNESSETLLRIRHTVVLRRPRCFFVFVWFQIFFGVIFIFDVFFLGSVFSVHM